MLTRIISAFAALAVIGLAAIVAALPATAQSGGDPSGSSATAPATATATPTATPAPGPTSFAVKPSFANPNMSPNGITRMGNKWYVGGHTGDGFVYIFSDAGAPEGKIKKSGSLRGLSNDGTNLIAITGRGPQIHKWAPQADASTAASVTSFTIPNSSGYVGQGVAYDDDNNNPHIWAALKPLSSSGQNILVKLNGNTGAHIATYRMDAHVDSLTYDDGHLYALMTGRSGQTSPRLGQTYLVRDLVQHRIADLRPSTVASIPTNTWKVTKRNAEIQRGLVFHDDGTAYGFSADQNSARRARPASDEKLFVFTSHLSHKNMQPHGLARVGDKWHVAGRSGGGYVHIFSNTGTYERRVKAPADADIRGLASDGTSLFAAANSVANAISVVDGSSVAVYAPHIYKWTPQADATTPAAPTTFCIPNSLGYTPNGIAYDASGTHIWVALNSPTRNVLVKLNGATGAHLGTYRMNAAVSGLTYENGNLYALSNGDIVMAVASHLKTSPATWVNNWETVKRNSGLRNGLVFRDGTAYGFNAAQDEVRAERGNPTIVPASPAALPAGSVPPTGSDPSGAASPPSDAANPSN